MQKGTPKIACACPIIYYIDPIKLRLLMNAFIKSQFNYCPLAWMFHDRRANAKGNKTFERALRIACNDCGNTSVNTCCNLNKSLTIHQRNLQLLMMEIFKTKNNFSTARKTGNISYILKAAFSSDTRQSMKIRIATER